MNDRVNWFRQFLAGEEAATAVEYAVMLAMIIMAVLAGVGAVGGQNANMWSGIKGSLNAAGFGGS